MMRKRKRGNGGGDRVELGVRDPPVLAQCCAEVRAYGFAALLAFQHRSSAEKRRDFGQRDSQDRHLVLIFAKKKKW